MVGPIRRLKRGFRNSLATCSCVRHGATLCRRRIRAIDARIDRAKNHPNEPGAGSGHALARLHAKGATDEELTDLVREMQAELLFTFCYLLEDPGDVEESVSDIAWALVQADDEENVLGKIGALHESVLETDPTGREMRPRSAG
jgi:hypothetical protein